jgi:hypothetical protein
MFADGVGTHEVERAGSEAVGGAGQGAHRTDLHGVAGEIGLERLLVGCADLLLDAALEQVDEWVTRNLGGEAGAALTEHAPFSVEQHVARDRDRLREGPLDIVESGVSPTVAHRLVLQRALATLIADGTVQRVVDQEHLHDALLRLVGNRRGELGLDDHAGHDGRGAGRGRLGHAPAVAHVGDLDQAQAEGAGRIEQRVITDAGDLDVYFPSRE